MSRLLLLAGLTLTAWTAAPLVAIVAGAVAVVVSTVTVLDVIDAMNKAGK
jgi:hypothetical protein